MSGQVMVLRNYLTYTEYQKHGEGVQRSEVADTADSDTDGTAQQQSKKGRTHQKVPDSTNRCEGDRIFCRE